MVRRLAPLTAALLIAGLARTAAAEVQVGGSVGGRFFSDNQLLGFNPDAATHRSLRNAVVFTGRVGMTFGRYLVPEIELPIGVTSIEGVGSSVLWLAPRGQVRLNLLPGRRAVPFVLLGGGASIAWSGNGDAFRTSIQGNGYVGVGAIVQVRRNVRVRFDARLSLDAGLDPKATLEGEIGLGLVFPLGGAPAPTAHAQVVAETTDDADGDKVTGDADQCPSRAEDHDDFEDGDGCPDIDNDGDRVLDDIDKCGSVPEAINGYQDDDGCPDAVPAELEAKLGVIAGLTFASGKAELPAKVDAMLAPYVALLAAEPSIKLLVIGHAGADEVVATDDDDGSAAAQALSLERAEAVAARLYQLGVGRGSLDVVGRGASEPVAGKAPAQRRAEIRLYVPTRE